MRAQLVFVLRAAVVCMMLGLLAACGSDAVKPNELKQFHAARTMQVVWRASVGKAKAYVFTPALHAGSVFAAGPDGRVVRLDAASGKEIWRIDTKRSLSGGVGADTDMVLVGTSKGLVLAYDLNGKPLWTSQLSSEILSAPRAANGIVVARTGDGRLFGLDAASGERKWDYQFTLPSLLLRTNAGVNLYRDMVLAGLPGGKVVALNLMTGNPIWDTTISPPKGDNELERITDIGGALALEGDHACAAAYQGRVACIEITKGTVVWGRDGASASSLGADAITLYLTDPAGIVLAYDRETGATVWKQDKLLNREVSGPAVVKDQVVVGDFEGYVHALSLEDGAFVARLSTDGSAIASQPLPGGPGFIVQTHNGGIYAISIK